VQRFADRFTAYYIPSALSVPEPAEFEVYPGEGVVASVDGERVVCGTERLVARAHAEVPEGVRARVRALAAEGRSVMLVARGGHVIGLIALGDTLRPEVPEALAALRALGVRRVLLLTGDRHEVAMALARQLGLEVRAELLPEQKIRVVEELQRAGHIVAMVGDGINDAPALAQAQASVSLRSATPLAQWTADVVVLSDELPRIADAIAHARRTFRIIRQNLAWAFLYNAIAIPAAAFGFVTPLLAAVGMSVSSLAVVANALRLSRLRATGASAAPERAAATSGAAAAVN
jgi:Cu+-exporting ATPase